MDQYSNYGGQQEPPSNYGYQQYNEPYGQGGYVAPANPSSEYYYGGDNPPPPPPSSSSTFNNSNNKNNDNNGSSKSSNDATNINDNFNHHQQQQSQFSQLLPPSSSSVDYYQQRPTSSSAVAATAATTISGNESYEGLGGSGANASGGTNYDKYNSDNSILHTSNDTIYISNLSKDVTEANLAEHFGGLGMLKIDKRTQKPKIWIYYDKITGLPKGDATITYEDPDSTAAAIRYFNNQPFLDQVIKVEMSVRKISATGFNNKPGGGGGGRGGGGFRNRGRGGGGGGGGGFQGRGRGGPPPRDGDWACDSCNSNNFARRMECYKCHTPRSNAAGGSSGGARYGSSSSSPSSSNRGGYKGRRGGMGGGGGGGGGGNYSNSNYDQGYGRQGKPDDRQDRRDRHRPY